MGVLKAKVGGVWVPISQGFTNATAGIVGTAIMAADQTIPTGGATTDLTGVSVTWNAIAGHTYRIGLYIGAADVPSGAATQMNAYITDGSNNLKRNSGLTVQASSRGSFALEVIETGLSGSQTRKARFASTGNSTIIAATGAQTFAPLLIVEDITQVQPADTSLITAWTAVTFQNGWANFGGGYQTCQYRKVGDVVQLRGVMTHATGNSIAFTLPAGFWPPTPIEMPCVGDVVTGNVRLAVNASGMVTPVCKGNVWITNCNYSVST